MIDQIASLAVEATNLAATAQPGLVEASISDKANQLIADWSTVIRGAAVLAAITIVVITAIKTKLAWAATALSLVVGGAMIWGVTMDGLGWFSQGVDNELAIVHEISDTTV
ncbi:hypothetical protein [Microbacterium paludicola]|uniref:hypothetical protein n=1 Tax=Microbacterium paludicola TaxID=300019 RepID=UPI0031D3C9FD